LSGLGDRALMSLIRTAPHSLRELSLTRGAVSDAAMEIVAKKCGANLESLSLEKSRITNRTLAALGSHCPALQVLDIKFCRSVSDEGIRQLLFGTPQARSVVNHLRKIYLTKCKVSELALPMLARCDLHTLVLTGCPVGELALLPLLQRTVHLRCLYVQGDQSHPLGDRLLQALSKHCPNLQVLHCQSLHCTPFALQLLCDGCGRLRELGLARCRGLADIAAHVLGSCRKLHTLHLNHSDISDLGVLAIGRACASLRMIDFTGCTVSTQAMQSLRSLGIQIKVRSGRSSESRGSSLTKSPRLSVS
jgi:hypothetical protein